MRVPEDNMDIVGFLNIGTPDMIREMLVKLPADRRMDVMVKFVELARRAERVTRTAVDRGKPKIIKLNLPTISGAVLGERMANDAEGRCGTCAFRKGTIANACLSTLMDAEEMTRTDGATFECHEKSRKATTCEGWKLFARERNKC